MATATMPKAPRSRKPKVGPLTRRAAWKALQTHYKSIRETTCEPFSNRTPSAASA